MNYSFVEHLRNRIKEEAQRASEHLASGRASSYDEYRHLTGIIHGLAFVEREINDLMDAFDKE
jgi:hypothetical protein